MTLSNLLVGSAMQSVLPVPRGNIQKPHNSRSRKITPLQSEGRRGHAPGLINKNATISHPD
jgi:hypothetical protein